MSLNLQGQIVRTLCRILQAAKGTKGAGGTAGGAGGGGGIPLVHALIDCGLVRSLWLYFQVDTCIHQISIFISTTQTPLSTLNSLPLYPCPCPFSAPVPTL